MRNVNLWFTAGVALALAACQSTPATSTAGTTAAPATTATPSGTWSKPGDSLHDRVHDALMEQMGPAVNDLGVRIEGSAVFLTGHVHSEADKQRAHDIAHGVDGAGTVDVSGLAVRP